MYEFFEDEKCYYIVYDLCKGGELFEEIVFRGKISEKETAVLIKQILICVNYLHQMNIIHRDLKPENFLLEGSKDFNEIKMIDFWLACKHDSPKVMLDQMIGSSYYIAPEVLAKRYNNKCDLWSVGVITYIALSGVPPFNGSSDKDIIASIRVGKPGFSEPVWKSISDAAKEFIKKLLTVDPEQRPSA
jgi:calcium-dependent protein kinase